MDQWTNGPMDQWSNIGPIYQLTNGPSQLPSSGQQKMSCVDRLWPSVTFSTVSYQPVHLWTSVIDANWFRLMLIGADWCWLICWMICWLVLTDADWCWLLLVDAVWCWLILIVADWFWMMLFVVDWGWLNVIDSDLCWLVMIDSDWCLLVLIDAYLWLIYSFCADDVDWSYLKLIHSNWCWLVLISARLF